MNFRKALPACALAMLFSCASSPKQTAQPAAPVAPPKAITADQALGPATPWVDSRAVGLPAGADTALWVAMDSLLQADFTPTGGVLGAYVARLGDTSSLWQHNPDTRLLPASTQKVYAAVAGMSLLGSQFRWRTTLWRTGSVQGSELKGDLILEGGGDPTLGSESGATSIYVAALKKLGVETVHGNLVALDTIAGRGLDAWPGGWTLASAKDGYGAPVVGLNWNQNRSGDRAILEPRPEALKALRKALLAKGITVKGTDTTVRVRGDSLIARRNLTRVATVASPGLELVMRTCLRESVNPFAEGVVLGLGLGRRGPVRDAGLRRLRDWLEKQGMDASKMVVDDGSGLSRYDLTTARQMSQFLARDARNDQVLLGLLAKGGEGTLRKRFSLFPNPSQILAKTGTLDGVSNLTGYLIRSRDTLAFTFFCSGYWGPTRPVRELQDRWLARLQGLPLVRPDSLSRADSLLRTDSLMRVDSAKADTAKSAGSKFEWVDSAKTRPRFPPGSDAPVTPNVGPKPVSATDSIAPPRDTTSPQPTAPSPIVPPAMSAPNSASIIPPEPGLAPTLPAPAKDTTTVKPTRDSTSTMPPVPPLMGADPVPAREPPAVERDPLDSFARPYDPDKVAQ